MKYAELIDFFYNESFVHMRIRKIVDTFTLAQLFKLTKGEKINAKST